MSKDPDAFSRNTIKAGHAQKGLVPKFSVTAYIVERGLILEPYEMESKTNEITALPAFIKQMALQGESFYIKANHIIFIKLYFLSIVNL